MGADKRISELTVVSSFASGTMIPGENAGANEAIDIDDLTTQVSATATTHIANTSNPHSVTKAQVGLANADNTSDLSKPISTATQAALNAKYDASNPNGYETPTQLNTRDTNNRNRSNHSGTQLAATISDFSSAVAATAAVTANTAKVTNATHTGDVTGATALTLASVAITGKTSATPDGADSIVYSDASDSGNLKKCLISELPAPTGDTTTYKTTSDQSGITTFVNITGLSFTPIANTTYKVIAYLSYLKSNTSGINTGVSSSSSSGISYLRGYIEGSGSGTSLLEAIINLGTLNGNISTSNSTQGNLVKIDIIFRSNGSPVAFNLGASNNGSGTLTVAAGSIMEVQQLT